MFRLFAINSISCYSQAFRRLQSTISIIGNCPQSLKIPENTTLFPHYCSFTEADKLKEYTRIFPVIDHYNIHQDFIREQSSVLDNSTDVVVYECGSVLKKRRSKMNKHKYKKLRKRTKFLRRRLK